jgi:hypothetical protein
MKAAHLIEIVQALNEGQVRYLIVGGLAVNAHGYLRYTNDVDVVLQLEPGNILRGLNALSRLGYRPKQPVDAAQFADASRRRVGSATRPCWYSRSGASSGWRRPSIFLSANRSTSKRNGKQR